MIDKYSKEELTNIVNESFSLAEVLSKLGYSTKSGRNSATLQKRLKYYDISTEHFTYKPGKRDWTDEEIFCENSQVSQSTLRRVYRSNGFSSYQCKICGLEPFWNGAPLVLTLDHINGRNRDNRYENLRWICPNCDRQSSTFGMRNKKNLQKGVVLFSVNNHKDEEQVKPAINYKKENREKRQPKREIEPPDRQQLKDKLWVLKSYTQVANHYNVSPTQIRRWCRKYDLPATINIIKHTSELGWKTEEWNDLYEPNKFVVEKSIPCYMIDKDTDEVLKEFSSRNEAVRYLGLDSVKNAASHVSAVCNGTRKTAYGYKWKNKNT